MPNLAIACGVLLILIGLVGYIYGMMNDRGSITALIPAFIGIVLALLGVVSGMKENLRKHLMHGAVLIALLGFVSTAGRLGSRLGELTATPAVISQALTALVCLIFMILAIRTFAASRRSNAG
jgi:drug/metabolite transporter (DMT)-like permease